LASRGSKQAASSEFPATRQQSLRDQVALVTGASSGIGRAIALALAARGAEVGLVGRDPAALQSVADAARPGARAVRVHSVDLTRDVDVEKLGAALAGEGGKLDVLVHSAGVIALGPMSATSVLDFDAQYRANLRGPYLLTQLLLPLLRTSRGQIVFINSSVGLRAPGANVGQFAATQHAFKAIADSLRDEVNPAGIRVLSIFPGRTATPRQARIHEAEGKRYLPELLMQPEDIADTVVHALELPRTTEITDISMRPFRKPPS
jgi:NADP-dependent 3-hydroxy acid dehydrogenase YdfG